MVWITIGIFLIIIGFLISIPALGIGSFIPILGDIIDIPLGAILILVGTFLLLIGGVGHIISQYWWVLLIMFIIWYLLSIGKISIGFRRAEK